MNKAVYISFVAGIFWMFSCSEVSYWHSPEYVYPIYPPPVEIQYTDSVFNKYEDDDHGCLRSNSGYAYVYDAKVMGDTVLVYNYYDEYDSLGNVSFVKKIDLAYIKKGRKLFEVYPYMPYSVWRNDTSFSFDRDSTLIDTSKMTRFYPNWKGWRGATAFVDYGDNYAFLKGENKKMRASLTAKMRGAEPAVWRYTTGLIVEKDTVYHGHFSDSIGPFKFHTKADL
ncbi:MAG: hypothetical protein ABJG68_15280 [Crocinitomicaceae bacterium]